MATLNRSYTDDDEGGFKVRPPPTASSYNDDIRYNTEKSYGCCGWILMFFCVLLIVPTFFISLFFCLKIVRQYERAVILRLGKALYEPIGPGLVFLIPCTDEIVKVDLRTVTFDVAPQEILTKDSVTVTVDAVVYYKVNNPMVSVLNVEDAHRSTQLLAATILRNVLGMKTLAEILSDRDSMTHCLQIMLDKGTDPWGIKVERVEIKSVRLPQHLQRVMATEAEVTREARAKFVGAEGEKKASRSLKEAADIMSESSSAIQLRYLQTLNTISAEKNSTIIFPLPIYIIKAFKNPH